MSKFHVIRADITAKGSENKDIKSFDNYDNALKFYYECFHNNINVENKVCTMLTDENLNQIKKEVWIAPQETAPEEITEE